MSQSTPATPATPATPPPAPASTAKTNTLAIVSLIASILWFPALIGVITGHIAISQIKRTGEGGRGMAVAGLIIGYIGIASALLWGVFWIIFVVIASSSGYTTY
jgi:hypothetical protein